MLISQVFLQIDFFSIHSISNVDNYFLLGRSGRNSGKREKNAREMSTGRDFDPSLFGATMGFDRRPESLVLFL
jgi:hypothetical protein